MLGGPCIIKREIEPTIDAMLKQGKVVLVTGARQVGKTTVLKQHLGNDFNYVSMENQDYLLAKEDAVLFSNQRPFRLLLMKCSACQSSSRR